MAAIMSLAVCLSPTLGPLLHERERSRGFIDNMPVKHIHRASTGSATCRTSLAGTPTKALEHVPAEVFVEIYKHLDLRSALNLAATGRRCAAIFKSHRSSIVLEVIKDDFGPVEELLQLVVLTPSDLQTPWGTWLNKPLRRHKKVLCEGGTLPEGWPAAQGRHLYEQIQLEDKDVEKLLSICKVVKGWERIYPQYRFHDVPMSKRSLTATENERLRRALYAWMRYAYYFHGDLPRPLPYIASGTDVRVNQLRCLSNKRLRELQDLWMTVQDIIEVKLCPSIETIRVNTDFELTRTEASRIGWGDGQENQKVIATMSKLSPAELLFYVDNSHKYTKNRLIQEIRAKQPSFESDTETLGIALSCVYSERYDTIVAEYGAPHHVMSSLWFPSRPLGDCCGGILDMDDPELEAASAQLKEMDGLKLAWRAEDPTRDVREEVPTGLLDV